MQDKRVHPNKKVFLTLLNSLSKRGHHGLIREVCTLNVECLVKMASIYIFFYKKWGEKVTIIIIIRGLFLESRENKDQPVKMEIITSSLLLLLL